MIENSQTLQFEAMWEDISKTLKPIGQMPDKASLDYKQIQVLYSELRESGNTIRDLAQISIFKKELACNILKNLVN
jgi:hypothetical protein